MIFQNDPPTNPNQPKGIKVMLEEHGLWIPCLHLECKKPKCKVGATLCCAWQLFGQQQKSLVQEVVKVAGHLCIFLLKFHCELNFIEFFGGAVKKYLCDNSNYTFGTLKEELQKALASVNVKTIRKIGASHNHTMWWLDAHSSGKGTKEAQLHVKQFSSCIYKSHHYITYCYPHE